MANHAYVKSRRNMTPEGITSIIERLNNTIFKGCLKIEYHKSTKEEPGWGEHTWMLTVINPDGTECGYFSRVCWLDNKHHFEMRHGGGMNFIWWIDCAICNEIALHYNGTWTDDGVDMKEKGTPGKYNRFRAFQRRWIGKFFMRKKEFQGKPFNPKEQMPLMWASMQQDETYIPQQFRMNNWRFFAKSEYQNKSVTLSYEPNPKYSR